MVDPIRAKSVFVAVIEQPPAERAAFLEKAVGGDVELRARVEDLLKAHDDPDSFLDKAGAQLGTVDHISPAPSAEHVGTLIGPYKLLEQIGEGGMGVVYMAEQQKPVRRRVALKIIKAGMDTRQVIARFEAERQALALMDHTHIARVLDAGATDSGRPYFVMELVRGIPITEYCDQNNLPVHERLELFIQVCHAVQHAHQKGIIHRDIKPSNVLVTINDDRAVPKVIDFGVAKATNQQLTEKTLFTAFAQMVGTPLYMSPEQAEMTSLDIDTRSDIYSLGVLLYELLTGTTPFDQQRLREAAFDEMRRIIREEEPPKPSTRISTLGDARTAMAAHRKIDANRLGRLVQGDLDWIVMKSLEKDRKRRYETASSFAADVERHINNEPVLACPPSLVYRFHKFARRNKAALLAASLLMAVVIAGIVGSTWEAIRATHAEQVAREEADDAKIQRSQAQTAQKDAEDQRERAINAENEAETNLQNARKAVDDYFTLISQNQLLDVPGLQPLRKELLEAARRFYKDFAHIHSRDPTALADVAVTTMRIAEVNQAMGQSDDALAAANQALDVIDELRHDYPDATEQRLRLAGHWKGLRRAGGVQCQMPLDRRKAVATLARVVNTWTELADENPSVVGFQNDLSAMNFFLGFMLSIADDRDQAMIHLQKAYAISQKLSRDFPGVPEYRADLARTCESISDQLRMINRKEDAENKLRESLALREQLVASFPKNAQYRDDLAQSLAKLGLYFTSGEAQEAALRQVVDLCQELQEAFPGVNDWGGASAAMAYRELSLKLASRDGDQKEAEKLHKMELVLWIALTSEIPEFPDQRTTREQLYWSHRSWGSMYFHAGRDTEAIDSFGKAIAVMDQMVKENINLTHYRSLLAEVQTLLGDAFKHNRNFDEANPWYHRAIALYQQQLVDSPEDKKIQKAVADINKRLSAMLIDSGRQPEVVPASEKTGASTSNGAQE